MAATAVLDRLGATSHTLIVTDWFSCRSQIEHGTEHSALHLAQVVQMALRDGPTGSAPVRNRRAAPVSKGGGTDANR